MSEWLGKRGEHLEADITVKGYVWRPHWGSEPKLFLLEDKLGNIITIRTTVELVVGQRWLIDGIVKRHHNFKGQRQTHIARWGLALQRHE